MQEFQSDVPVELTEKHPQATPWEPVYTSEDRKLLRSMSTYRGATLAESLGYNDPILGKHGGKPHVWRDKRYLEATREPCDKYRLQETFFPSSQTH